MCACGNKDEETTAEKLPTVPTTEVLDISNDELIRSVPKDYKGQGGVFQLGNDTLDTDVSISLYSVKLKCSDGQERQSWSLQKNVAYLSNEENKEHTDGVVSTTDNITMMSYVAARENATVGEIMDAVSSQEINKAEGGTFLVSDTVECKPNIFLTDYITSNESTQAETFYILTLLDEDTVQIYSISRTYDESSSDVDPTTAESSDLLKYFLASDDNRNVFCGIIQALLQKL